MKSTMEQQAVLIEALDAELDEQDRELFWCKLIIVALVGVLIWIGLH